MGRFGDWVAGAARAEREAQPSWTPQRRLSSREEGLPYLVDNSALQSQSRGICYRCTPRLADKDLQQRPAPFGSVVRGEVCGHGGWLRIGERFLPMVVGGAQVLIPVPQLLERLPLDIGAAEGEEAVDGDDGDDPDLLRVRNIPAWLLGRSDLHECKLKAQPVAAQRAPETQAQAARAAEGEGEPYAVVCDRAVVRRGPSMDSLMENFKCRSSIVELFDWDDSREWRRCFEASNQPGAPGWMRLDHPVHGQLLRPLDPVCAAAYRGAVGDLRRCLAGRHLRGWRGAGGLEPMRLAARRGSFECCVLLVRAGADAAPLFQGDPELLWGLDPTAMRVILAALTGGNFEIRDFEAALGQLPPDLQDCAERLFDEAALQLEARRGEAAAAVPLGEEAEEDEGQAPGRSRAAPEERHDAGAATPSSAGRGAAAGEDVPGVPYRVVHANVCIRKEPRADGDIIGTRQQGRVIDMFEYDRTGFWRRVQMGLDPQVHEPCRTGWMLLRHVALGALLEPLSEAGGSPLSCGGCVIGEEEAAEGRTLDSWDGLFRRR